MKKRSILRSQIPTRKLWFYSLILLFLTPAIEAQDFLTVLPQELALPESDSSTQTKSADAVDAWGYLSCWNGSYYSDYWVYFQYSGFTFQCDCSSKSYNVKLIIDGKAYWPGWVSGRSGLQGASLFSGRIS